MAKLVGSLRMQLSKKCLVDEAEDLHCGMVTRCGVWDVLHDGAHRPKRKADDVEYTMDNTHYIKNRTY